MIWILYLEALDTGIKVELEDGIKLARLFKNTRLIGREKSHGKPSERS